MQIRLIVVGLIVILLGILRHFAPGGMSPGIFKKRVILPGYLISGVGVLMVIAGILLE